MRMFLLRLAVVFSVIMAGMHMPDTAHAQSAADSSLHHDHHANASDDVSNENGESPDIGSDVMHHHHCPIGLDSNPADMIGEMILGGSLLLPANSAALRSRATEPPLEPPLA